MLSKCLTVDLKACQFPAILNEQNTNHIFQTIFSSQCQEQIKIVIHFSYLYLGSILNTPIIQVFTFVEKKNEAFKQFGVKSALPRFS